MNKPNPEIVCEEIMEILLKDGFSYQVTKASIEKAIFQTRGVDKRTTDRWLKVLLTFNYLIPVNRQVYEMNVAKVPGLVKILRNNPQTHISTRTHTQI